MRKQIPGFLFSIPLKPADQVTRLAGDASNRAFFRVGGRRNSVVVMVYPGPAALEIASVIRLSSVYRAAEIPVPAVIDQVDDRALFLEDLGDLSLQKAIRISAGKERENLLIQAGLILQKIAAISPRETLSRLNRERALDELLFFHEHLLGKTAKYSELGALKESLNYLACRIPGADTFAHRDFHSRNIMVKKGRLYLIDFQDSLVAPAVYDLVSLAFDSYLEPGEKRRLLAAPDFDWESPDLLYTALQRNLKALGTFAFQAGQRGRKTYLRYIPRTIRHALGHLEALADHYLHPLANHLQILKKNSIHALFLKKTKD